MRAGIASRSVVNQLSCQGESKDLAGNREPRRNGKITGIDLARKTYSSTTNYTGALHLQSRYVRSRPGAVPGTYRSSSLLSVPSRRNRGEHPGAAERATKAD